MSDLNKVMLIGKITTNLELKKIGEKGRSVVNFTLATNTVYKNKKGEKMEETEYHRCIAYGKLADIITQYLTKGKKIYVEGRLRTRQWEDTSGNKRYITEIIVSDIKFCEPSQIETPIKTEEDIPF